MQSLYYSLRDDPSSPYANLEVARDVLDEVAERADENDEDDVAELKRRLDSVLGNLESPTQEADLVMMLFHLHDYAEIVCLTPMRIAASLRLPLAYIGSLIEEAMERLYVMSVGASNAEAS